MTSAIPTAVATATSYASVNVIDYIGDEPIVRLVNGIGEARC